MLITGGSGFVGRNITQRLGGDYEITAPRHKELDLQSSEDTRRFLREHDFDFVVHCANVGGNRKTGNVPGTVEKNLRMFLNLAENRDRFGRMVHFGSGAEYDKTRALACVREDEWGQRIPRDDYGFSKYAISRCIEGMDGVCCLRLFGVFGPYEDYEYKFISNSVVKSLLGMPLRIMQNVCFDWLYVDDLTDVVARFLEHEPRHKAYNVTTGRTTDLLTIAGIINDLSPRPVDVTVVNQGLNLEYSGDNARLIAEMPGYRFTPVREAVGRLRDYYAASLDSLNLESVRKDPYAERCAINKA